jgi:hypothetical protein
MVSTIKVEPNDWHALYDFVVGNTNLEKLEALANQFNIFEALEVTRRELTHSNILASLLDRREGR